ncbi:unnamed protein product [Heterobilharzia americana]|nr:unnamed protein product [Heterobilharzia americana]
MFKLSHVLFCISLGYFCFVAWSLYEVFYPQSCKASLQCLSPAWKSDDHFKIHLNFVKGNLVETILKTDIFQINSGIVTKFNFTVPSLVINEANVTARLQLLTDKNVIIWSNDISLMSYKEPFRMAFNLLSSNVSSNESSKDEGLLVPFWLSTLRVYVLNTAISFSRYNIPLEIARRIQLSSKGYLPVIYVNPTFQTSDDWFELKQSPGNHWFEMTLSVEPLSIGRFRLRCMLETMADQLRSYGMLILVLMLYT